jgi:hypothetical protein
MLTSVHDRHGTIEGLLNGWQWRYAPMVIFSQQRRCPAAVLVRLMFTSVLYLGMGEVQPAHAAINPFCSAVAAAQSGEAVFIKASNAVETGVPFAQFRKRMISASTTLLSALPRIIDGLTTFSASQKKRLKAGIAKNYGRLRASLSAAPDDAKARVAYTKWLVPGETGPLEEDAGDATVVEALKRCGIRLEKHVDPDGTAQSSPLKAEPIALTPPEVLDQLNRRGGQGYAFKGAFFFGTAGLPTALFVQTDPGAKYEYVADQSTLEQQTKEGLLATLQKRGGQGFVLQGPLAYPLEPGSVSLIFLKNSTKKTTFGYRIEPRPADETASISLMNANGADGYVYIGDYVPELSKPELIVSMFVKDNSSAAKYSYETGPVLDAIDQIFAELNARGAAGAGWKGTYLAGTEAKMLYEKSSESNGPLEYAFGPASTSAEALVTDAIERGAAKGLVFSGQYNAGGQTYNFYTNAGTRSLPIG